MKIGVDLRCFQEGRKSGVAEYALNLLSKLLEIDRENQYVLFFNSFQKTEIDLGDLVAYSNVEVKIFRYPNKLLNLFFWYFNWPKIDRMLGGTDVLFFPNINFAAWSKKTKAILTIHDLSFERYSETFSWKRRLWHFFVNPKKLSRKADKIVAVSDSTRNDLEKLYEIKSSKIKVIHSAAGENFTVLDRNDLKLAEIAKSYNLPYKFILYLGTIEPRKNIIGIIRAFNQLRSLNDAELNKYKLVIAGAVGWKSEKIFSEIKNSPFTEDIIMTGVVAKDDMSAVYNLASIFIYPSFFEGFGFPPLEAMQCGLPVVASNNSSLPEIVGEAGILVDPDKPDEIYQAMKEVLQNRELSAKLRQSGLERAKKFTWQETAEKFLEVIKS
jgi:glycosyltransferase involved in cell wall biosynthesis